MNRLLRLISIFFILICCSFIGCSAGEPIRQSPAMTMGEYSSIAVAKFVSPEPAIGQRVAERLAVKFAAAGYSVTRFEKLAKISGKDVLTSTALTPTDKAALQANGIKAVLYGAIERYECQSEQKWSWTGYAPEKVSLQSCSASLSIRIVDSSTGLTVWQTNGAHSEKAPDVTARMVMERVLTKIEDEIPQIRQ
ncbi:MAG: hypothetical protein HQL08_03590 [Nitrospirae bacterium]|nr:hypothetical protein [Nitrospirota bacterium]